MSSILKLAALCWVIVFTERLLFWLWLWQLKEYHYGRFKSHFSTYQGKKLILNFSNFVQIILIVGLFFVLFTPEKYQLFWPLIWLVLLEAFFVLATLWTLLKIATKRIRIPVLTKKTVLLLLLGFLAELLILILAFLLDGYGLSLFLITLFLSPFIFSLLVWLVQPLTVWQRNRLLQKAKQKRDGFKNLLVIGITGSYGKTTTKEFLATILAQKFKVLKTKEHINAEIGIAQTILKELTEEYEIFVAEIGAYEKGKIKQVCQMLRPKIGVLTGVAEQHMATFGSQENIIKAKYELIESLPQDGLAVFNGFDKHCQALYQKTQIAKKITAPTDNIIQAIAQNLLPWDMENLLMAKEVAQTLAMSQKEIDQAIRKIKSPIQIKKGVRGLNIIDNTYSANPKSVSAHLEYLKTQPGKKILVMPCLIELGFSSKEIHRRIGKCLGEVCDLAIITTKDQFQELKQAAQKSGMPAENIIFSDKPKNIIEKIKRFASPNDTILLESRVPKELINELIK